MKALLIVSLVLALVCFVLLAGLPATVLSKPVLIGLMSGASLGCGGLVAYGVIWSKS